MRTLILGLCAVLSSGVVFAQATPKNQAPEEKLIARGKYLVERVAMCQDCHSPRNERGEFDTSRWLGGSMLAFKPASHSRLERSGPASGGPGRLGNGGGGQIPADWRHTWRQACSPAHARIPAQPAGCNGSGGLFEIAQEIMAGEKSRSLR